MVLQLFDIPGTSVTMALSAKRLKRVVQFSKMQK